MFSKFLTACLAVVAMAGLVGTVIAVGAPAGTVISNQAYGDYKDANGNNLPRVFSNTVTTTVTQVAGVDVVPPTATQVGVNGSTVVFLSQIFNTGNGIDQYDFTVAKTTGWVPTDLKVYYDQNNNHIYEPGTDPELTAPFVTGNINPDDDYDVWIAVTIPAVAIAPDQSTADITLTATSKLDGTKTDFGTYTAKVSTAAITAQKTHSPAAPKPGDVVTYTITLTNNGTSAGTTVVVNDAIPTGMTYVPGSITLNAAAKTDAGDADGADYNITNAGKVSVNVGTIAAGGAIATVTFQVTVNAGVPSGSTITNQASVSYSAGVLPVTTSTNGDTLFVQPKAAVSLTQNAAKVGDPGDQMVYPLTVSNNTNGKDTLDITTTSTGGWTWVIWVDSNNDGIPGNDGDYQLTDTDGDGKIDTGEMIQGASLSLLAVATIPPGTADKSVDTTTVTATSSVDTSIKASVTLTTTVTAPVLTMSKVVSPTGNQPPGTVLTYTVTITNGGTGVATSVVITDVTPAFTAYQAGTIKTGATVGTLTGRTDNADGDGAHYEAGSNSVVTDNTTLGPTATLVVQFQVKIN